MNTKTVIEVPDFIFEELRENQKLILENLQILKTSRPANYLTAKEFMTEVKISRWKFNELRNRNLIEVIQRGRILYIPVGEVQRFFQMEL